MSRTLLFSITPKDASIRRDTFRSGGPGGQHQNKTESGVRFTHLPSGAVGESRESRSQHENERRAWRRMVAHPKFQWWVNAEVARLDGAVPLEERVAAMLDDPKQTVVEVRQDGRWVPEPS